MCVVIGEQRERTLGDEAAARDVAVPIQKAATVCVRILNYIFKYYYEIKYQYVHFLFNI